MQTAVFLVAFFASSSLPLKITDFPTELFWDQDVYASYKAPFAKQDSDGFTAKLQTLGVVTLESGCGRLKNRLARLEDGTKVCCRYRDTRADLRSDMYAYHLASLLGIDSVPPTVLVTIDFSSRLWSNVAAEAKAIGWHQGSAVELAMYVDGLSEEYIPDVFKPESALVTKESARNYSTSEKLRLLQWTDMIAFDYITGHTDRLFSTMLNLQWTPNMLQKPVHNLEVTSSGQLVLLDNESAFWLGYATARMTSLHYDLQAHFLKRICVFRRETIESIEKLATSYSPWAVLEQYVMTRDHGLLVAMGPLSSADQADLAVRLRGVMERVHWCSRQVR